MTTPKNEAPAGRLAERVPLVDTVRTYRRGLLRGDLLAAVTIWAIVIPEGVAYAGIAGMPPQVGLYVALVPLVVYALLGTSRRMSVGPSATTAALSAAAIAPFAAAADDIVQLTIALTIVVGVVLIVAAVARLGIIAEFLSEPVLKGFLVGVGITIAGGQLAKLFGVDAEGDGFIAEMVDLVSNLGDASGATVITGFVALGALFALHRWLPQWPSALIVMVGGIASTTLFDLEARGVELVGDIPGGLPSLVRPDVTWTQIVDLIPAALGITIVVFGESMALAKSFGTKHGERLDANAELGALGVSNVVNGFFGGFAATGSSSRTSAADSAGQNTQVASLLTALLLVPTMVFLTPVFTDLPEAVLGAIVIHAVIGLIRFRPIISLRPKSQVDFAAAVTALAGVLIFDILAGLMIGVAVSVVAMMRRAVRPRCVQLGLETSTGTYWAVGTDGIEDVPGVIIMRFEAELFFANVSVLRQTILDAVDASGAEAVVLDAESISHVDVTAAGELAELLVELDQRGVRFVVAHLEVSVGEALQRCDVDLSGQSYPRVSDAVEAVTG